MKNNPSKEVTLRIAEGQVKENVTLLAYVVDNNGNLIETATFSKDVAKLKQNRPAMANLRVYIAQQFPKEFESKLNERSLVEAGAYHVIQSYKGTEIPIARLADRIFEPLCLLRFCPVEGNVSNMVVVNGEEVVSPVCNARVHIEQIETRLRWPWPIVWYDRLPGWVIDEIRDKLLHPPPIQPIAVDAAGDLARLNIISRSAVGGSFALGDPPPPLPESVMQGIRSTSRDVVLKTLAENHEFLVPYFCLWEWLWPWLYYVATDETIVYTDCNGNFESWEFLLSCNSVPTLNIYIWVEVLIGNSWVPVFRPWLPCGTHWSYSCGSPINISLQDANIPPCGCAEPIPGAFVQMDSVNGGVTIRSVQQSPTPSGHLANAVGLTAYGGDGNISPFGSSFTLRLLFGAGLQGAVFNGKAITHYRWSYTRITDAYLQSKSDTVHYLNSAPLKPYWYYKPAAGGGFERIDKPFSLGPVTLDPGNNSIPAMFKIPHGVPDQDDPSLPADAQGYPYTDSIVVNTAVEKWLDGLYEFTFELLDDYGNVVAIPKIDCPFLVQAVAGDVNPDNATAINADGLIQNMYAENYVIHDALQQVIGFNFQMRIDNTPCYAGISDAIVAGHSTDTECGTGTYTPGNNDQVELIFQVGHPHNFATYSFDVYKGNSGTVAAAEASGLSANANNLLVVTMGDNGYLISQTSTINTIAPVNPINPVVNMDEYQQSIPVATMLGTCITAAFAEDLHVWATHTDGLQRLDEYDEHYEAAIAISPGS